MKKLRYFLMMFLTAAICAGFQSCSDDEEDGLTYSDFYIECTNVSGGGWSSQECAYERAELNKDLVAITLTSMTKSEAIDLFNQVMENVARDWSGSYYAEPLKMTFELRMMGKGQSVKRATITITEDGASVS